MCDPFGTKKAATRSAEVAAQGSRDAANAQYGLTEQGLNYLQPLVESGTESRNFLRQILGFEGQGGQDKVLSDFRSSPDNNLLQAARDEAVRRSTGQHAAAGLSRSGALTQDLAERTSGMDLDAYYKWRDQNSGLFSTGANAAGAMSEGYGNLGAIKGSGIAGAANATSAGITNRANANANLWGTGANLLAGS